MKEQRAAQSPRDGAERALETVAAYDLERSAEARLGEALRDLPECGEQQVAAVRKAALHGSRDVPRNDENRFGHRTMPPFRRRIMGRIQ